MNASEQANGDIATYPTATAAMAELRRRNPNLRFCASNSKGKAYEAGWQLQPRAGDPAEWPDRWVNRAEWCVVPSTAGLFLVDVDEAFERDGDDWTTRKPTKEEALELGVALGGGGRCYESTPGKGSWHLWFADSANGGRDWGSLKGATASGFASANGMLFETKGGVLLKFDTRGGGIYTEGHRAGSVTGCRIDADLRRLRMMIKALDEGVWPIANPQVLADGVELKKAHNKPGGAATAKAVHDHILTQTFAFARLPEADQAPALAQLLEESCELRRKRGDMVDQQTVREEIERAFEGAKERVASEPRRPDNSYGPTIDYYAQATEHCYKDRDEMVEDLNKRYAHYTGRDEQVVDFLVSEASDDLWPSMMSPASFRARLRHVKVERQVTDKHGGEITERAAAADEWLRHGRRRAYEGQIELLAPDEKPLIAMALPVYIHVPKAGRPGDTSILEKYVIEVLCNGDENVAGWLMDWNADIVQRPASVGVGTGVILRGHQGSGKSSVFERIMEPILGKLARKVTNAEGTCRFNYEYMGKALLFWDDVLFAGDRKMAQRLKDWLTAKQWNFERKHHDPVSTRNTNRHLVATNAVVAAYLESGDRRWLVLETPLEWTPAQLAAKENIKYFDEFMDYFRDNVDVMAHFFLNRKYDRANLLTPPLTDAKLRITLASEPMLRVLHELATTRVIPGDGDGQGRAASRTLAAMCDKEVRPAHASLEVRRLLGADGWQPQRGCRYPIQNAYSHDGGGGQWRELTRRGDGLQLSSPYSVAKAINPLLPVEEQIDLDAQTMARWAKWRPGGGDENPS